MKLFKKLYESDADKAEREAYEKESIKQARERGIKRAKQDYSEGD